MRFVQFSYFKTANRTIPYDVVWCGILLLVIRRNYAILRVVLVQFLRFARFMQFGEHPYIHTHTHTFTVANYNL